MIRRFAVPVERQVPTGSVNAYLVGDDPAVLVDPGGRTDALDDAVEAASVDHVVVTHSHPDHVGAVDYYARETDATVWCRRCHERRFAAASGRSTDRTFVDGTTLPSAAGRVAVVDTPGHAPDHVAFAVSVDTDAESDHDSDARGGRDDTVLCGDLAVAEGSVAVAAPDGDVRAYLESLRRLRERAPRRLLPGHGPAVEEPTATLDRLLAHRRERERRVLRAVERGARPLDDVVDAAYEKDVSAVWDLARATTRAHLEKLAADGELAWDAAAERTTPRDG